MYIHTNFYDRAAGRAAVTGALDPPLTIAATTRATAGYIFSAYRNDPPVTEEDIDTLFGNEWCLTVEY